MLTEIFGSATLTIEQAEKMQKDEWFGIDGFPVHDGKTVLTEWFEKPQWER